MKILSRKFHAVLDYMSGIVLIAAPWALHFEEVTAATTTAIVAGALILLMSLMTSYEGGIIRIVPMPMHLNMDVLLGLILAASPWLVGFNYEVYLPHLIMGILTLLSGLTTVRSSLHKLATGV